MPEANAEQVADTLGRVRGLPSDVVSLDGKVNNYVSFTSWEADLALVPHRSGAGIEHLRRPHVASLLLDWSGGDRSDERGESSSGSSQGDELHCEGGVVRGVIVKRDCGRGRKQ
jgi:hypothetical protein